ncbi:MAG TPA: sugar ABC transporter permease [Thermomicrobiales bacterium]|nr:sugar ABC transporter permease [Thermomicrobiales bacterium]
MTTTTIPSDSIDVAPAKPAAGPRRRGRIRNRRRLAGVLFVLPAALFIFTFMLYPLIYSGYMSLTRYNFVYDATPTFIAFGNYIKAMTDPLFVASITNTFVFGVSYFVIVMIAGLGIALLLFQKIRFNAFFRSAIFVPIVVPLSLACLIFLWILQPNYGFLNYFLGDVLHLPQLTQPWLSNGPTAMVAIVVVALWASVGFVTILFLAGLQGISNEVLEAAEMDGARGLKKIVYIIVPSLRQTFVVAGTWAIIHGFKVFVEPMVMTAGGPRTATLVLYQNVYQTAFTFFDMGYASAMGYILGAIILIFVGINFWFGRTKKDER